MKLNELAPREAQHLLLYGDPKSGKTTLVAELANHGYKLLWFSMDNGHEILYKLPLEIQKNNIEIVVLPDNKDFPVAIDTCLKVATGARVRICNLHGQVNCSHCTVRKVPGWTEVCLNELEKDWVVVFDNLSQLADSAMNFITQKEKENYKPQFDDWGLQGKLMARFLTNLQNSSFNVAAIAHTLEAEMEDGSMRLVPQVGTRAFSRNVGKYFDHIVHASVKNMGHKFGSSTIYLPSILTGSRSDVAIEKDKEKVPSLVPFFQGLIKPGLVHGEDGLEETLLQHTAIPMVTVGKKLVEAAVAAATPAAPAAVSISFTSKGAVASIEEKKLVEEEKKEEEKKPEEDTLSIPPVPDAPNLPNEGEKLESTTAAATEQPAATNATSQPVAIPSSTPISSPLTPADRAKAALAALRAGKKI